MRRMRSTLSRRLFRKLATYRTSNALPRVGAVVDRSLIVDAEKPLLVG